MAGRNVLSHESASGRSISERLSEAGVLFAANGENVARSGTFLVDLIHRSFMDSPGHRENILNADFDEVGVGIIRGAGGAYFITEDFIRSLVELPEAEVRARILGVLNEARAAANRPPAVIIGEADRAAEDLAKAKAGGQALPPLPPFFGEALVRAATGPDLGMISFVIKSEDLASYGRAGIGVEFGRTPEYPGGAYLVCLVLIKDNPGPGPDDLDRLLVVLKTANDFRLRKGLVPLILAPELSRRADDVISMRRKGQAADMSSPAPQDVYFMMFHQLDRLDGTLRTRLEDSGLRRIGISTLPIQTEDGRSLLYALAIVLAR